MSENAKAAAPTAAPLKKTAFCLNHTPKSAPEQIPKPQPCREQLRTAVKAAFAAGLSVAPPDQNGTKAPRPGNTNKWEVYKTRRPTVTELNTWYANTTLTGIGIICGGVSGNVECLEFDDPLVWKEYESLALVSGLGDLFSKLKFGYSESSPSGGIHFLYKCEKIEGSKKLATRPKRPEEMAHPKDKIKTLIETRGEGGYIVTAPSFGTVHPTGKPYELISGGFDTIPTITPEERDELFTLARSLHVPHKDEVAADERRDQYPARDGGRPGDDFNATMEWADVLGQSNWKFVYSKDGVGYWRRPGKDRGVSATTNYAGTDLLKIFTSSTEFEAGHTYSKFGAYAVLNCGGNFKAAAKALAAEGFGSSETTWDEPLPLPDGLPPVKKFDFALLPEALRPWIHDIAERLQCAADFVAVGVMAALGSLIGRKLGIRPQAETDWTEVPNQWALAVGRPGVLKSPALVQATGPLKRLAAKAQAEYETAQAEYEIQSRAASMKVDAAKKRAAEMLKKNPEADISAVFAVPIPDAPQLRRYVANDSTPAALAELLRFNPNGLLVFRDEIVSLLKGLDREDNAEGRGLYLTAWNGDSPYTIDRITRGQNLHIPAVCISLLGSTQPGRLSEYVCHAVRGGAGDDGLIQRFGLAVWPDTDGTWVNVDRHPDEAAKERAYAVFDRLADLDTGTVGAQVDFDGDSIPYLRFSADALALFTAWRTDLEHRLRSDEMHPALESHLAKYRKLVPTLALVTYIADDGRGPVTAEATRKALAWADYLESHARRIYASVSHPEVTAAKAIIKHIIKGDLSEGFHAWNVWRPGWSMLSDREQVADALRLLVDYGWLRENRQETGGRPSTTYEINPAIFSKTATTGTAKGAKSPPENEEGPFCSNCTTDGGRFSEIELADILN